jgi:hypothetical protein
MWSMPRDDNDDRPKKSWREIDQAREKGTGREPRGDRSGERLQGSQAYRSYKTQLNKLFDGGALPEALKGGAGGFPPGMKERLGDAAVVPDVKKRKDAAASIVAATKPKDFKAAMQAYIDAHGFPEEEEVLAKVLDSTDEGWVLQAIETATRLHGEGALKRGASLKVRLKTVQLSIDDPDIVQAAKALLAKL